MLASASVTACSGGEVPTPLALPSTTGIIDRAPVASEADLATSTTAQAIKTRGGLKVASTATAPLMSQQNVNTGRYEGFDATLSEMFAKYVIGSPNRTVVNAEPATREPLLATGTVDIVFMAYSITPERAEKVGFAGPYLYSGLALATRADNDSIRKPADLNGKTVITVSGTTASTVLKQFAPNVTITEYDATPAAILALEQGRGDAYCGDLINLAGSKHVNHAIKLVAYPPLTNDPEGIGIKRGDEQFKQFVNTWLRKIMASGLWKEVWAATYGQEIHGDPPQPPQIGGVPGT
ncbi:transporter substrate-binding domain-containing protein [Amycolatopsis sp. CA-230715]|uniref:transporter substrate-binding domain-containing protein n=1 Tax=Amycolatopsis sp. CA-230715 TaxID=2745196 RepID=UPI0020B33088|nr:transporter substrate-binding domain-containing protein [Amycolatopsis sp. CA-230715]